MRHYAHGDYARFRALAGGCIVLTSPTLTACRPATSATSVPPGFAGYEWQAAAGHNPAVLLADSAMGSFGSGVHATVKLTGDWLAAGVGPCTLTCQRGARESFASLLPIDTN